MAETVFDTDIIIDHLRGVDKATKLMKAVESGEIIGYISVITEAELCAGDDSAVEEKVQELNNLLDIFRIVEVDRRIAIHSGHLRRKYGIGLPDAIIAATALIKRCKLITRNLKDFEKVKEIEVKVPY